MVVVVVVIYLLKCHISIYTNKNYIFKMLKTILISNQCWLTIVIVKLNSKKKKKKKKAVLIITGTNIIGIKHGFSCINIRQVPWEVLKTEAWGVFSTSQGTWRIMNWKTMFDRYYLKKKWKHLLHFSLFLALFCFAFSSMSRERNFHGLCSF